MESQNKQKQLRIAVLVSGGGTNLQALIDYEKQHNNSTEISPYTIVSVLSDRKDAFALERAKNAGISTEIISAYAILGSEKAKVATRDEKRFAISDKILSVCQDKSVDLIVLAGFLTVLGGNLVNQYSNKIINLHPALLPKFGGEGMWGHHVHEAVLAANEKESGCTIHFVDKGCDTGRILIQKKVPVLSGDTVESLYNRIAPQEHIAMIEGVLLFANEFFQKIEKKK